MPDYPRHGELTRLSPGAAGDADEASVSLPPWARTLVVTNPLTVPIWLLWGHGRTPTLAAHDASVPPNKRCTIRIPTEPTPTKLALALDFTAAVPTDDVGRVVIVEAAEDVLTLVCDDFTGT